ncbi:hypothetical protein PHYPSEUDO_015289 [Phytophthora pseudosyringae]|uniref:Secreted protein n=1 Tax=Phytophthora pseudosyringae TaxID=221518 RepID=A0A8T1W083_9STRA|nr:hypothetical protein PHYPSEUDO_015289 [Phytophthora pseudosyringae]
MPRWDSILLPMLTLVTLAHTQVCASSANQMYFTLRPYGSRNKSFADPKFYNEDPSTTCRVPAVANMETKMFDGGAAVCRHQLLAACCPRRKTATIFWTKAVNVCNINATFPVGAASRCVAAPWIRASGCLHVFVNVKA